MTVNFSSRAQIALDHLPSKEAEAVMRLAKSLENSTQGYKKLNSPSSNASTPTYIARVPPDLRMLFRIIDNSVYVVDVIYKDRLDYMTALSEGVKV